MSIYNNETKIYPDLNPTAPQEPQTYRLQKLTEIEAYLFNEIEDNGREAKKMKQFKTITGIVDTGLIISAVITGGTSIATSASAAGLPVGAALARFNVFFSLSTVATRKPLQTLTVKQGKHNAIKLLAQSKLNSMANISFQAMQYGNISPTEFHRILQEVENYRKLKVDIENRAEAKIKQIMEKQRKRKRKRAWKIFYEKQQTLQVPSVSVPFKI